jgi:hypothetical protein
MTSAFPVIPKKKIRAYKVINVAIIGRRLSSGIVCSVVVLIVIDGILVELVKLIKFSLLIVSNVIVQ